MPDRIYKNLQTDETGFKSSGMEEIPQKRWRRNGRDVEKFHDAHRPETTSRKMEQGASIMVITCTEDYPNLQ